MPKGIRKQNGLPTRIPVNVTKEQRESIERIIEVACKVLGVDKKKVLERDIHKENSEARYIITHVIRERFRSKIPHIYISELFNRKTHNCSLEAEALCKSLLSNNKYFREKYNKVVSTLESNR